MQHTIAAVFDNRGSAERAMAELMQAGFPASTMRINQAEADSGAPAGTSIGTGIGTGSDTPVQGSSMGSGIKHFFSSMFGSDSADTAAYASAVERGNFVLTLDAPNEPEVERAADIIEAYGPLDIDEHGSDWRDDDPLAPAPGKPMPPSPMASAAAASMSQQSAATGGMQGGTQGGGALLQGDAGAGSMQRADMGAEAIPVMREELKVGKRSVQRGGVRIYQRMVETPVSESVNLSEEHVSVERRPVDRPADPADLAAFKEGTMELRETAEEAVVEKSARIVEEVVVGKVTTEHEQKIDDTVKSTEVEVEKLAPAAMQPGQGLAGDQLYRTHWSTNLANLGGSYDDYEPAYRYGAMMADNDLYAGRPWAEAEPDLRQGWERNHPQSAWDKAKGAIRYGWDKLTQ